MIPRIVDDAGLVAEIAAGDKEGALKELIAAARAGGAFPDKVGKAMYKRLLEREAIGSTGLGNGVAVPHVKHEGVERMALVLGRARAGLEWHAIDGRPVHVLFLLVSPADQPEVHLQCLRWIAMLARNADFRRFLLDAEGPDAMRELLREMQPKG
ncbi:MAG: PTS sugar transporter subunit IIA [Planctomycetes bacterium]|nr:PTS sugar transporter subunit IIA [Planctomycetota bacterium]